MKRKNSYAILQRKEKKKNADRNPQLETKKFFFYKKPFVIKTRIKIYKE